MEITLVALFTGVQVSLVSLFKSDPRIGGYLGVPVNRVPVRGRYLDLAVDSNRENSNRMISFD